MLKKLFGGSIVQNTLKTTLVFGVRLIAQAGTLILLARLLGPAQFGEFSAIAALAVLMGTLSTFGTHLVLLGETAIDPANATGVLRWAIPTTLICGLFLFSIYLAITHILIHTESIPFSVKFFIGITELIFQPFNTLAVGELQGSSKTAKAQKLLSTPLILRLIILIIFYFLRPVEVIFYFSIFYLIATLLAHKLIKNNLTNQWPSFQTWQRPKVEAAKLSISYAMLQFGNNASAELDKTIALKLTGAVNAGIYTLGSRILGALSTPVIALTVSAMPKLFKNSNARNLIPWFLSASLLYGTIAGLTLFTTAKYIPKLFGGNYIQLQEILELLSFTPPATCIRLAIGTVFMSTKQLWTRFFIESSGMVFFLFLSLALTEHYSYKGFTISFVISEWYAAIACAAILFTNKHPRTIP